MSRNLKVISHLLCFLFLVITAAAQDTIVPVHTWQTESRKIGEGKFELVFSAAAANDWKIYSPNQVLLDVHTTELRFADPAVKQQGDFIVDPGQVHEVPSAIFENTKDLIFYSVRCQRFCNSFRNFV